MKLNPIQTKVTIIIATATFVRLLLSALLELGNDEVYYWTYARFPDFSHFDHPPMVGFLIQATTLNLFFTDDFFLRLGPVCLAAIDTWLMYRIGTKIKDEATGLVAAIFFTSSIYCSLIAGFAIIPDAPEVFFWILSINCIIDFLPVTKIQRSHRLRFFLFAVFAGLAMLSKYHAIFLWVGVGGYILLYNRKWFYDYSLYLSIFISLLFSIPIVYWNATHDFITFTFHGERVTPGVHLRPDYFFRELGGQIAYNNPFNFVLIVIALIGIVRKRMLSDAYIRILLLISLPLYVTFTGFSLFRSTLPHWTGPSFLGLLLIASVYWAPRLQLQLKPFVRQKILWPSFFILLLVTVAVYVINYTPFSFGKTSDDSSMGEGDFTLDMYGWESIGRQFKTIAEDAEREKKIQSGADLISWRWYPGAHEDFYVAAPMQRNLFMMGDLNEIHKYYWINQERGGLTPGRDYYYIDVSNYFRDPQLLFGDKFQKIIPLDTIRVFRSNNLVRRAIVYKLERYKER